MTARSKKIWKIVGVCTGVLLLIGAGAFFYYKSTKSQQEEDENPFLPSKSPTGSSPKTGTAGLYSKSEIENMQSWLLSTGISNSNQVIIDAINTTGGVDGKIGNGFWTALTEAKKEGYVENLEELYDLTN